MKKILSLAALAGMAAILASTPATGESSKRQSVDALFEEHEAGTPGVAFVIVKDGEVIEAGGYGTANLQYDIPMSADTVVDIGSVSKQFTAFGILLLAEDGKLALDDDVREYIPELPDYGDEVTLRHLVTHTSGLREWIQLLQMSGYKIGGDIVERDHVFNLIISQKDKNFPAGETFSYTNSGFDLLAIVIERVTGKTFADFAHQRIFQPLGMEDTFVRDDDQVIIRNEAARYFANDDGYGQITHQLGFGGSGGIHSTMSDLGRWIANFQEPRVGSAALFELMNERAVLNNGETTNSAAGQFATPYRGVQQFQHSGGGVGINTHLARFPGQRFGVAVVCNDYLCDPRSKAEAIADLYLGLAEGEPAQRESTPIALEPAELEVFAGHYWNEDGGLAREVYLEDGTLWYRRAAENVSKLVPVGDAEFRFDGAADASKLFFGRDPAGRKAMTFTYDSEPPQRFIEYQPRHYATEELEPFAGVYLSDELLAAMQVSVADGALAIGNRRGAIATLQPVMTDTFSGDRFAFGSVRFLRDEAGSITGFVVSNPSAKGVKFERLRRPGAP